MASAEKNFLNKNCASYQLYPTERMLALNIRYRVKITDIS